MITVPTLGARKINKESKGKVIEYLGTFLRHTPRLSVTTRCFSKSYKGKNEAVEHMQKMLLKYTSCKLSDKGIKDSLKPILEVEPPSFDLREYNLGGNDVQRWVIPTGKVNEEQLARLLVSYRRNKGLNEIGEEDNDFGPVDPAEVCAALARVAKMVYLWRDKKVGTKFNLFHIVGNNYDDYICQSGAPRLLLVFTQEDGSLTTFTFKAEGNYIETRQMDLAICHMFGRYLNNKQDDSIDITVDTGAVVPFRLRTSDTRGGRRLMGVGYEGSQSASQMSEAFKHFTAPSAAIEAKETNYRTPINVGTAFDVDNEANYLVS